MKNYPSQFKNEHKLPTIVYIFHNFQVLHFGEHFMKIGTKTPELEMHENLHKNMNSHFYANFYEYL